MNSTSHPVISCSIACKVILVLLALMPVRAAVFADNIVIAQNGQPTAIIVVPDAPLPVVAFAAQELQYHIHKASGAKLQILKETEVDDFSGPLIILGYCNTAARMGIKNKWDVPNSFVIKLIGNRFLMIGDDTPGAVLSSRGVEGSLHDNKTHVGTLFAVYEFLDTHLAVRWLWPGELGEVIPQHKNIAVDAWDELYRPQLLHTRLRDYYAPTKGWSSPGVAKKYFQQQAIWMRRHRMAQGIDLDHGHAFGDWWGKYGQNHPEYFALRPDGQRAPAGAPHLVQMCVAEPAFWGQIIENWKQKGCPNWINCWENDSNSRSVACTCEKCRAWDVLGAPDLSDRYARFWLEVQERALAINPDVMVAAGAYSRCSAGPIDTKLNQGVVIGVVPTFYYPWTNEHIEGFRRQWQTWSNTGARLYLRPNWFYFGHNFPVNFARKFFEAFSFAYHRNMIATDFDLRAAPWATQGLSYYALGRAHCRGDWPAAKILNEYYAGFGHAADAVRQYFEYWEKVTDISEQRYGELFANRGMTENMAEHLVFLWYDQILTSEVMANAKQILQKAASLVKSDGLNERRIDFLARGLEDVELTLDVERQRRAFNESRGNSDDYFDALKRLKEHRNSIEHDMIENVGYLYQRENSVWDYQALNLAGRPRRELAGPWKFMWDPVNQGIDQKWYQDDYAVSNWHSIDTHSAWQKQPVGKQWKQIHGSDYNGLAWYRTEFTLDQFCSKSRKLRLLFGAVDEACIIWVNGMRLLDRPYPYKGNADSWNEPFEVDVSDAVKPGANILVVRVEDSAGLGGIFKPVYLLNPE